MLHEQLLFCDSLRSSSLRILLLLSFSLRSSSLTTFARRSFDFWLACVAEARGLGPGREGDKCQLFYQLFGFLKEFEPECLNTGLGKPGEGTGGGKIRRGSWKEQGRQKGLRVLSEIAKEVGDLPGDVFANKAVEGALKGMFGFAVVGGAK